MTDAAFLLAVLNDGQPHSLTEILRASIDERGHGLTVHSRVADLRKQGHIIICERILGARRGQAYTYQLLGSLSEGDAGEGHEALAPVASDGDATSPSLSESQPALFEAPRRPSWA